MRLCKVVSEEYAGVRESRSILPQNVGWMEDVGGGRWRGSQLASSSPFSNNDEEKGSETADPVQSSSPSFL